MLGSYLSPETFMKMQEVNTEERLKNESFYKIFYKYPIFEKQYNLDGVSKNIYDLFEEMSNDLKKILFKKSDNIEGKSTDELKKEYSDCKNFYYELILLQLEFVGEDDYKKLSQKYGVTFIQSIFSDMEKYFNDKYQNNLQYKKLSENELKKSINAIVRFRNGMIFNPISEELLRMGGFVRGTRESFAPNILKRRELFAKSLIGVYDAIESEEEYRQRAENEKCDIDEVIDALYYNRFENFFNVIQNDDNEEKELEHKKIVRMAQILKMAKIISDTTKQDYFREFLKIPDVNNLMISFEGDRTGYLGECMKKAQIRIKKVVYPATEAEEGKYSDYILGNDNTEDGIDIKRKVTMLKDEIMLTKRR